MQLKKTQRNDLFEALVEGGVDPATCELESGEALVIQHSPSNSAFVLSKDFINYKGDILVGDNPPEDFVGATWDSVTGYVLEWARQITQDMNTSDLWAEFTRTKEVLESTQYEASENTPFSAAEQTEISNQLREIKASLKENAELTAEQVSRIEYRLDEAEQASRRIGRKDWLLLFSGTIFTLIVTDCLTPDVAQHILMVALHGLNHLFLGGIKPIPYLK